MDANNLFHPLFYEGAVDIDKVTDPVKKKATLGFINNFGQMPKQVYMHLSLKYNLIKEIILQAVFYTLSISITTCFWIHTIIP